jgi:hypothetical protein
MAVLTGHFGSHSEHAGKSTGSTDWSLLYRIKAPGDGQGTFDSQTGGSYAGPYRSNDVSLFHWDKMESLPSGRITVTNIQFFTRLGLFYTGIDSDSKLFYRIYDGNMISTTGITDNTQLTSRTVSGDLNYWGIKNWQAVQMIKAQSAYSLLVWGQLGQGNIGSGGNRLYVEEVEMEVTYHIPDNRSIVSVM